MSTQQAQAQAQAGRDEVLDRLVDWLHAEHDVETHGRTHVEGETELALTYDGEGWTERLVWEADGWVGIRGGEHGRVVAKARTTEALAALIVAGL